jgi:hypothetical protein
LATILEAQADITVLLRHNIRLVNRLASDATNDARHDLHDSAIQPYIELQMGLVAIPAKVNPSCVQM